MQYWGITLKTPIMQVIISTDVCVQIKTTLDIHLVFKFQAKVRIKSKLLTSRSCLSCKAVDASVHRVYVSCRSL